MTDDLTLIAGGRRISGWNSIRVTRGIERMPSDFALSMTERFPGELDFVVQPGDTCQAFLGEDLVINGYVDRYTPAIDGNSHSIGIAGRGRCADLVDCAATWPGWQISATNALDIAQKLGRPYGISARNLSDAGPRIPQFPLNPGETAYSVIEKVCRFAALLVYEDTDGTLILSRIGSIKAASGFTQGVNVQSAALTYSQDQRYSQYDCMMQSMAVLNDVGTGGFQKSRAVDSGVLRYRNKLLTVESGAAGFEVTKHRVQWEMARRFGRSFSLRVVTDSWRDSAGTLYTPNTLVDLSLPLLKCVNQTWVISEVTYKLEEESGTSCELTIMPQEAFSVQPILLQPITPDVPSQPGAPAK
ncbi:MAG: hypothetical protein HKM00_07860 [Gallionella sp.]|nr:hypothetical protein [Gallionella sp.]